MMMHLWIPGVSRLYHIPNEEITATEPPNNRRDQAQWRLATVQACAKTTGEQRVAREVMKLALPG